jgi:hypothetical protein
LTNGRLPQEAPTLIKVGGALIALTAFKLF